MRLEQCRAEINSLTTQLVKLRTICHKLAKDLPEDLAKRLRQEVDDAR